MEREKVIEGLECCSQGRNGADAECGICPYNNNSMDCNENLMADALELIKALDVTPEELERLKKCRHECKIDCLLEHFDEIKAERDALLGERTAVWHYHNDAHGQWWECGNCGKVCHKNPHDKKFCSICGFIMKMES